MKLEEKVQRLRETFPNVSAEHVQWTLNEHAGSLAKASEALLSDPKWRTAQAPQKKSKKEPAAAASATAGGRSEGNRGGGRANNSSGGGGGEKSRGERRERPTRADATAPPKAAKHADPATAQNGGAVDEEAPRPTVVQVANPASKSWNVVQGVSFADKLRNVQAPAKAGTASATEAARTKNAAAAAAAAAATGPTMADAAAAPPAPPATAPATATATATAGGAKERKRGERRAAPEKAAEAVTAAEPDGAAPAAKDATDAKPIRERRGRAIKERRSGGAGPAAAEAEAEAKPVTMAVAEPVVVAAESPVAPATAPERPRRSERPKRAEPAGVAVDAQPQQPQQPQQQVAAVVVAFDIIAEPVQLPPHVVESATRHASRYAFTSQPGIVPIRASIDDALPQSNYLRNPGFSAPLAFAGVGVGAAAPSAAARGRDLQGPWTTENDGAEAEVLQPPQMAMGRQQPQYHQQQQPGGINLAQNLHSYPPRQQQQYQQQQQQPPWNMPRQQQQQWSQAWQQQQQQPRQQRSNWGGGGGRQGGGGGVGVGAWHLDESSSSYNAIRGEARQHHNESPYQGMPSGGHSAGGVW